MHLHKYHSNVLVLGMVFALLALVCLTVLESVYVIAFRQLSAEVFAGIISTITFILGAVFGANA